MPEFNDLRQISESGNSAFRQGQAMTAQSQANALGQLALQNAPREIAQGNRLTELKLRDAETAPQKAIDEERKAIVMTFGAGLAKSMQQAATEEEKSAIYQKGSQALNQFLTQNNLATPEQKAGVITPLEKMGGAQGFISMFSGSSSGESLSQKEYDNALQALQPALDANGNIDESKLTAASRAAGIKLRLLPGAQGSAAITTALTPGLTGQVAGSNAVIAGATEGAKTAADLAERIRSEPTLNAENKKAVATAQAKIDLPKVEASANTALGLIDRLKNHPGIRGATGLSSKVNISNYVPGSDEYDFAVEAAKLEGMAFLQAFESLRNAGQITEIEGKKATQASINMNTAQSTEQYVQGLNDLAEIVTALSERARKAAKGGDSKSSVDPALLEFMTPEEKALFQ
jgi:hypothetical protein